MNLNLPADYHTHTRLCRHAGGEPLDYARAAAALGIGEIACTDHLPFPNDPQPSIRMTADEFDAWMKSRGVRVVGRKDAAPAEAPAAPAN